ncbi:hypothetical protein EMIT0P258_180022 [Pseudomonas sp. IT-P258]
MCAFWTSHLIGAASHTASSGSKLDEVFCTVHPILAFEIIQLLLQMRPSPGTWEFVPITHKPTFTMLDKVQQALYLLCGLRCGLSLRIGYDCDKADTSGHHPLADGPDRCFYPYPHDSSSS